MTETDTAHAAWDETWNDPAGRAAWETPEDAVLETALGLRLAGARTALDLGAGVGRHALALSRLGFEVTALDASGAGLAVLRQRAASLGLDLVTDWARMTALPLDNATMDYVLAWNVIYHGDGAVVRAAIAEMLRVLRPGGTLQCTMLPLRNRHFGTGAEIAPRTWVDAAAGGDKAHPHFYCSAGELVDLFAELEIVSLVQDEHAAPGNWHWRVVAEKA